MDWNLVLIVAGVVIALILLKRLSLVDPKSARDWLAKGAKVIDVRSPSEFQERHLPGAINVPLGGLREEITRVAPDKAQPLLLHCLSGGRSGLGKRLLRAMGYRHVFNLGSYSRAASIVTGAKKS